MIPKVEILNYVLATKLDQPAPAPGTEETAPAPEQKAQDELTADTQETDITFGDFGHLKLGASATAILKAIDSALGNSNEKLALSANDMWENILGAFDSNTITAPEAFILSYALVTKLNTSQPAPAPGTEEAAPAPEQKAQDELTADTQETGIDFGDFGHPELGDSAKAILTAINKALGNSNEKLALSAEDIWGNIAGALKVNTITAQEAQILSHALITKINIAPPAPAPGTEETAPAPEQRQTGYAKDLIDDDMAYGDALSSITNKKELFNQFWKASLQKLEGQSFDLGLTALDKSGSQRKLFGYKGLVFCTIQEDPFSLMSKRLIRSRKDLSSAENRQKAMGLGDPPGDTDACTISGYKDLREAFKHGADEAQDANVYLVDLSKLPQDQSAFDVGEILEQNNITGGNNAEGLVSITGIPTEAIVGGMKIVQLRDMVLSGGRPEEILERVRSEDLWFNDSYRA